MPELVIAPSHPIRHVVLIGGGEFSFGETREIDESLLGRMPPGQNRVAFLATASGSVEYAAHFGTYLRTIREDVETINVPIYRVRDGRRAKNLELLRGAGLVYLGAGVAQTLLDTLHGSPAEEVLRECSSRGVVVAAIGASANCFGSHVRDQSTGAVREGLAWFPGTVIETNFDPAADTSLRRLMSLPGVETGIGIPRSSAVAIGNNGQAGIEGRGHVSVFRKS